MFYNKCRYWIFSLLYKNYIQSYLAEGLIKIQSLAIQVLNNKNWAVWNYIDFNSCRDILKQRFFSAKRKIYSRIGNKIVIETAKKKI